MENNLFSGSENLYKYLVTVGILMVVLTVYYPLQEKRELELENIKLKSELTILQFKIDHNKKAIDQFKTNPTGDNLKDITKANYDNEVNELALESRNDQINSRKFYIRIYKYFVYILIPAGILLLIYGFIKWHRAKVLDDIKCKLENEKLQEEINKLRRP